VIQKINEMYVTNPTWHYSDEENFDDLKKRGLEALDYLKNLDKENVLVVSHGNFLSLLAGLMIFGNDYNPETALKFRNFLRLSNTGVCIFTYENEKWKLQCWNDTSHCLE
jgi:broad specificity phosphatase PhoE